MKDLWYACIGVNAPKQWGNGGEVAVITLTGIGVSGFWRKAKKSSPPQLSDRSGIIIIKSDMIVYGFLLGVYSLYLPSVWVGGGTL